VRSGPLFHDNVRTYIAQRGRPPRRISRKIRSCVPATSYVRGIRLGITSSVCSPHPARRRRSTVRSDAGPRARASSPPAERRHRGLQWAALLQTATLSIGAHLRRRTSHVPRHRSRQRPGVLLESQLLVRQPVSTNDLGRTSAASRNQPTARSSDRPGEDNCSGGSGGTYTSLPTTSSRTSRHKRSRDCFVMHFTPLPVSFSAHLAHR